jgi:hypothetical protein
MTGILLSILMVFTSKEGECNIDNELKEKRTTEFIHLFELMLLLETFCLAKQHSLNNVNKFKKFTPYLMNTIKLTLNRQTGNQMKLIKYHLLAHFADDILRFGSMSNFDTGIGESHHKTEAKLPAKTTQRRRNQFELQTAIKQIENVAINKAYTSILHTEPIDNNNQSSNWFRYKYFKNKGICYKEKNTKKFIQVTWKDHTFQNQLSHICNQLIESNKIRNPIKFFTLYKKNNNIFRADPNYKDGEPWYDWVLVDWPDYGCIPAKLMIFLQILTDDFISPFQVGDTFVKKTGLYAFAQSLSSEKEFIPAHMESLLVDYGNIEIHNKTKLPKLCIFSLDCIHSSVSGVPYNVNESIINSKEWLFLKSKDKWYDVFINLMNRTLKK